MSLHILITDNTHPVLAERLQAAGMEVEVNTNHTYQSLLAVADNYDALVVRSKIVIDRAFLSRCHRLRCIGRVGAGMETIDTAYAEQHGIRCLNSPEGNRQAVGEHTVGLILALMNNIARADAEVRRGLWQREANRGIELCRRTIGIIGFGNMGSSAARCLSGFGCRILAYDKYKGGYAPAYVAEASLDDLQRECDIVSLHVPLTDETYHMVDADFLSRFQHPLMVVNTSRGAVVNTDHLVQAMQQGTVTGAALDVMEYEDMTRDGINADTLPAAWRYLTQSPRTVLTPHVAGWTVESKYKLAAVLADKIINVLNDPPAENR